MVMLLTLHHMEFIFVNLFDLLEHLVMLQTSTLVKNFKLYKLLKQAYLYHKLRKCFSWLYCRCFYLISKLNGRLKYLAPGSFQTRVLWRLSDKLKKTIGIKKCLSQFIMIMSHYKKIGYNIYVFQQIAYAW